MLLLCQRASYGVENMVSLWGIEVKGISRRADGFLVGGLPTERNRRFLRSAVPCGFAQGPAPVGMT